MASGRFSGFSFSSLLSLFIFQVIIYSCMNHAKDQRSCFCVCLGDRDPTSGVCVPGRCTGQGHSEFIIWNPGWGISGAVHRVGLGQRQGSQRWVQERGEQGLQMRRKGRVSGDYGGQASPREKLALPPAAKASAASCPWESEQYPAPRDKTNRANGMTYVCRLPQGAPSVSSALQSPRESQAQPLKF